MVRYTWYTRNYVLVSLRSPMILSFIPFCSFCGEDLSSESVFEEYKEAYDKATQDDGTFRALDTTLESFRMQFLTNLEAHEKTTINELLTEATRDVREKSPKKTR